MLEALPDAIGELAALRHLYLCCQRPDGSEMLWSNRLASIAPLAGLDRLETLNLRNTGVSDLAPLASLSGLSTLHVGGTGVSDLSLLLSLALFAAKEARHLNYAGTPAADAAHDRRLDLLSRLPPERCALETMQYLLGEHPDFRDPPQGIARTALPARLAGASPVALTDAGGVLQAANRPGAAPPRPQERPLRIRALRTHVAQLLAEAERRQVSEDLRARFRAYAGPLQEEEPFFLLLDAPMTFLRGGCDDPNVTEALDTGFVDAWRMLVTMHDDLRPFLLPPKKTTPRCPS